MDSGPLEKEVIKGRFGQCHMFLMYITLFLPLSHLVLTMVAPFHR